jgi:hypothetical protein
MDTPDLTPAAPTTGFNVIYPKPPEMPYIVDLSQVPPAEPHQMTIEEYLDAVKSSGQS